MHETSLSVVSVARLPALAVVLPRQAPSVTAPALGTLEDVYLYTFEESAIREEGSV